MFLTVLVPWFGKRPPNDRAWKPEWAETDWVDFKRGEFTFHMLDSIGETSSLKKQPRFYNVINAK